MARATWVGLLVCLSGFVQADGTRLNALSEQINQCIDRQFVDGATPAIFARIDLPETCPQLSVLLDGPGKFTSILSTDQDTGNLAELVDLRYLVANMRQPVRGGLKLDLSPPPGLLDNALQLKHKAQQTGWWKQFIDWLFQRDPDEKSDADFLWLKHFFEKLTLSATTARIIFYISTFVLVMLALGLIWREIRLCKTDGWQLFRRRSATNTREEDLSDQGNGLSINPDTLPANLPALLNVCIDYLIGKQRLPENKSQTNHEYLTHLQKGDDAAAMPFNTLCQQAERVLYGGLNPDPEVTEHCLNEAKSLLSVITPGDH